MQLCCLQYWAFCFTSFEFPACCCDFCIDNAGDTGGDMLKMMPDALCTRKLVSCTAYKKVRGVVLCYWNPPALLTQCRCWSPSSFFFFLPFFLFSFQPFYSAPLRNWKWSTTQWFVSTKDRVGIYVLTVYNLLPVYGCLIIGINFLAGGRLFFCSLICFSRVLELEYCNTHIIF